MPEYRFNYSYRVTGETVLELADDDEARRYGWEGDDLTQHSFDIYDWDIDDQDVEIARLDDEGNTEETLL